MPHKVILLNGPPGSGKDAAASFLYKAGMARHYKFAACVKNALRELFGIDHNKFRELEKEGNQQLRTVPLTETGGKSWRESCIWLAESLKRDFGPDIFGYMLANKMIHTTTGSLATVISDCGFPDELHHIAKVYKPENCALWRIHREGCTYEGDSRNYVYDVPKGMIELDIRNEHEYDMYEVQILRHARIFLDIPSLQ